MKSHSLKKLAAQQVKAAGPGKHSDGGGLWLHQRENGKGQWVLRIGLEKSGAGGRVPVCARSTTACRFPTTGAFGGFGSVAGAGSATAAGIGSPAGSGLP